MARFSKLAVRRMTILVILMAAISLTMFSCATYCAQNQQVYVDMENVVLYQLEEPEEDAPVAVIHTSVGEITAVLYPQSAPNYVEQFIRLSEEGYYDNTYIYQVQKDVYFSAGSPQKDGQLSKDAANAPEEKVVTETSGCLWPFRGALCAPSTSHDTSFWKNLFGGANDYCGTRFLVCNSITFDDATTAEMEDLMESMEDTAKKVSRTFLENGGIPNYSQKMTVFGQAYGDESFETIDTITAAVTQEADPNTSYTAPEEDILITSIDITTWKACSDTIRSD